MDFMNLVLVLIVLVIVVCVCTGAIFFLFSRIKGLTNSNAVTLQEGISREIGEKVNSAFGESIKTLTEVANDKLGSVYGCG